MSLGGSGDRLAYAISNPRFGAQVYRIPPATLKEHRGEDEKDSDTQLLITLFQEHRELFYPVGILDREIVMLRILFDTRNTIMKDRIAAEQRLQQMSVGILFCQDDLHAHGSFELAVQQARAESPSLQVLLQEERRAEAALAKHLAGMPLYLEVFSPIVGMGPMIAARIICTIGTIRRFNEPADAEELEQLKGEKTRLRKESGFETALLHVPGAQVATSQYQKEQLVRDYLRRQGKRAEADMLDQSIQLHKQSYALRRKARRRTIANMVKYVGAHLRPDGTFPRRQHGKVSDWDGEARKALWLFGDQCNRRPDGHWGRELRRYKQGFLEKHPEVVEVTEGGRKRKLYTPRHLHQMATWRTCTRFAEWLFATWLDWEKQHNV